jgi:hypothetical protein
VQDENLNVIFNEENSKIVGVIAQDMDGDSRNDLIVTQTFSDNPKRVVTIVPWVGDKFDSSLN